ncbi:DMT family transporter [Candidatus Saccharibacteria bacterium]|nr:MAG: DMT family transporter [Candidatus Saccharibacteria bacterium]
MTWQVYIAVSVLLLSVAILLQRVILRKHTVDAVAFAGTFQLLVAVVMLPWALLNGLSFEGYSSQLVPIILATLGFGIGSVVYAQTLKHVDASAFSVLFATQAIWIMVAGMWLYHEKLTWPQAVGALFIFGSVVLLTETRKGFRSQRGLLLGLLTGLLFGIGIAASAYMVREVEPITWIWFSFILGGLGSLLVKPSKIPLCNKLIRGKIFRSMLVLSAIYALGTAAMNYAYIEGPFSLVAPIRQTGIIVTALLAFAFLRDERNNIARKLVAVAICTTGVVLLVV